MQVKVSRRGRYRKSLIAPQSLAPIAHKLEAVFEALDQRRLQGLLSDGEFLSCGLLTLLACRRGDAFQKYGIKNKTNEIITSSSSQFLLVDFWQLLSSHDLPISSYEKVLNQKISIYTFLRQNRFRGIPDSAQTALLQWLDNQYPLLLQFHIPSAVEVFELQKRGGRCISFLKRASELIELHHHRDALSFIVHDLIHAHEFYADRQNARQQIGFYHWLDTIKNNPLLIGLQQESEAFLKNWEYILSDMNSYCGHLLKTLEAAFAIHAAAGEGKLLWKTIVNASGLAEDEKILFRKINSPEWNEADFLQLESILEKWFQRANITAIRSL